MNNKNYVSLLLGLLSMLSLVLGVFAPAIDFSIFHESVQIQYSLMKICQNVGLISAMWRGIPYGILIAAVLMGVLSFTDYPLLKLVPSIIVIIMVILMLADIGNVADWVMETIEKFADSASTGASGGIDVGQVVRSFMPGIYCLAAGLVTGIVSCFVNRQSE